MPDYSPPFARLNLRRNPFGSLDPEEEARVAVTDADRLAPVLEGGERLLLQIVGPPGAGKTTLLRALRHHAPGPMLAWDARTGWPGAPGWSGPLLYVDDGHLLPERIVRRLGGWNVVVVATQQLPTALTDATKGVGGARKDWPVRTVDLRAPRSPAELRRIVDGRIEQFRRGPGPVPVFGDDVLEPLLDRHGPDLRAVLGDLYERIQEMQLSLAADP